MTSGTQTIVLPVNELNPAVDVLQAQGFRLNRIFPADAPATADLSLDDVHIRLTIGVGDTSGVDVDTLDLEQLRRFASGTESAASPIKIIDAEQPTLMIPDGVQSLVVSRFDESGGFATGRVGMGYRDLIPDRYGGRFIASHIRINDGGELSDYVHHHSIRFQLIFCRAGWVKVVYEDQGPPFILEPGDCVLQPPGIRHRVLESSPGLEVVEVGCPAVHDTFVDHEITLPTGLTKPDRLFGGQLFVHHIASEAEWMSGPWDGFEYQDTGIGAATNTVAGVRVLRPAAESTDDTVQTKPMTHNGEFMFRFVLSGSIQIDLEGEPSRCVLNGGDSIAIPAGMAYSLMSDDPDTRVLEVSTPEWPEIV